LIVHLFQATISLALVDELKISVASRFISLSIDDNLSILDFIALTSEELKEVKVEEVFFWKVAHVQTGQLIHASLSLLVISSALSWVGPWLVEAQV